MASPTSSPKARTDQGPSRTTTIEGLGRPGCAVATPHRAAHRSSSTRAVSRCSPTRTSTATATESAKTAIRASSPGATSAIDVSARSSDWTKIDWVFSHMAASCLRRERLRPAPAPDQVPLLVLERAAEPLHALLRRRHVEPAELVGEAGDPAEVERRHRAQELLRLHGAYRVGHREVVDGPGPEPILEPERVRVARRGALQLEERARREDVAPDRRQLPQAELEGFHERRRVRARRRPGGERRGPEDRHLPPRGDPLPARGMPLGLGEDEAEDAREHLARIAPLRGGPGPVAEVGRADAGVRRERLGEEPRVPSRG